MKKYALFYSNRKPEDNIILTNMFPNAYEIGLTDGEINKTKGLINQLIESRVEQFIFCGFEQGWNKLIKYIKDKYQKEVKVICNTQDSLLYYEYERNNFFKLLELNKEGLVDVIGFLRKGQYELYNSLGYKCFYLMENFILEKKCKNRKNKKIRLGVYPLSYTWDKNIFNQLCIAKMVDDCVLDYNCLDERMTDFLDTMKIESEGVKVEVTVDGILNAVKNDDIVITSSFTDYVHPVFFIAMENGIPCLVGNTVDFMDDKRLIKMVVTTTEDNPILNAKIIEDMVKDKEDIVDQYRIWKAKYDHVQSKNLKEFIEL